MHALSLCDDQAKDLEARMSCIGFFSGTVALRLIDMTDFWSVWSD